MTLNVFFKMEFSSEKEVKSKRKNAVFCLISLTIYYV